MTTATLSELVRDVRAEAGHALTVSQGLNTIDTIKHLIRRTEKELWTAFDWPQLVLRSDIIAQSGQVNYAYPVDIGFDQIRHVYWEPQNGSHWSEIEFGIPEDGIPTSGSSSGPTGSALQFWDTYISSSTSTPMMRFWPTPSQGGTIRVKGLKHLNPLIDDSDFCTLDPTLITLLVSSELLTRSKAEDAQAKTQKAQRHLQKLLANKISKKQKVTTFGANRGFSKRLTPYIDYIP